MVGRALDEQYPRVPHAAGEPVLEIDRLSGVELPPRGASLTLHRGEILGVAGIVGVGPDGTAAGASSASTRCGRGEVTVRHVASGRGRRRAAHRARASACSARTARTRGWPWTSRIADNVTYSAGWRRTRARLC